MECTADRLWGTGIPLNDPNCLDSSKWISQRIMGQILETICNNALQTNLHHYSWSRRSNLPQAADNNYREMIASNNTIVNANPLAGTATTSSSGLDQAPDNPHQTLSQRNSECSPIVVDSESASTTPVSDTTASDVETSETSARQLDTEVTMMEEGPPAKECKKYK